MAQTELPPLSPFSHYMNTPKFNVFVVVVFELEIPFTKAQILNFASDLFIPLNNRFSSIIITDEKGVQRWRKIQTSAEDHVKVPTFPTPTPNEENHLYDEELQGYISDISMKELPHNLPQWEFHLINYPTSNAAGTLILKLHHAIGDGYSLIGGLFSIFKRADNFYLPLKLPTASSRLNESVVMSKYSRVSGLFTKCKNTVTDVTLGVLRTYLEDDATVIRSRTERVEYAPVTIASNFMSLDQIKDIKSKVGATVNDVSMGLISYALHMYMKKLGCLSDAPQTTTALVTMNMRMLRGYKSLNEMLKANIWGNHSGFLTVTLPSFSSFETVDPLEFVRKAKEEMKRKTNSFGSYFSGKIISLLGAVRGPEAASTFMHSTLKNASITVSNVCGPIDQAAIAGNPIKNFYFMVPGVPQSLVFTIVTYMGKLRLVAIGEKGFIDQKLLSSCIKEAFIKIYVAACGEDPMNED